MSSAFHPFSSVQFDLPHRAFHLEGDGKHCPSGMPEISFCEEAGETDQLALPRDGVDLWLLFVNDTYEDNLVSKYQELLTLREHEQFKRFIFQKDSHRYLVTRALVRTVLSRYASVLPHEWKFKSTKYGRPVIDNLDSVAQMISFSISHTEDLVVMAVTCDRAVGVDTEHLQSVVPIDIADRYFHTREVFTLHAMSAPRRAERLLELWTLKESYIKARGMGFSIPLDCFGFDLTKRGQPTLFVNEGVDDAPMRWRFWQMRLSNDHIAALCIERFQHHPLIITAKRVIPLQTEHLIHVMTLTD